MANLRTFLAEIDDLLLRVPKPVPLDYVSALINQSKRPILFEAIEGHEGWQICDLLFARRASQARVLRTSPERVLPTLARLLALPPVAPSVVTNAPVKERIDTGNDADLWELPGFQHGEHDMGPVIIAMTICQDPETGRSNLGWTRMTPLSKRQATYFIGSSPHMRSILNKWEKLDQPMPMAFVVGTHPAYEIMASYSVPTHLEKFGELELVSSFLEETVTLVAGETVPLLVPAESELVIEGYVRPDSGVDEGPGPSQAGYYVPGVSKQPVFETSAVMRRRNPILRQVDTAFYTDHQPLISLPHEAILFERLREMSLNVHDVQFLPWGGTLSCVIKLTPEYDGQVTDMLMFVLGSRWPNAKLVIAVDDDTDIESPEDLHWCLATRVDPARDVFVVSNARGHPIDPTGSAVEGSPRARLVSKWGIDATKPPLCKPDQRRRFERALPKHWREVSLESYLR